jgi:membrane protein implicated in regulation of membrane protease activity
MTPQRPSPLAMFLLSQPLKQPIDSFALHNPYLNKLALVVEPIAPGQPGRVLCQGIWWSATCPLAITLAAGQRVYVSGRDGVTLIVEPDD